MQSVNPNLWSSASDIVCGHVYTKAAQALNYKSANHCEEAHSVLSSPPSKHSIVECYSIAKALLDANAWLDLLATDVAAQWASKHGLLHTRGRVRVSNHVTRTVVYSSARFDKEPLTRCHEWACISGPQAVRSTRRGRMGLKGVS
jgi:hypothetical protein